MDTRTHQIHNAFGKKMGEKSVLSRYRHVKGRVLVALADGTLAIFHRGAGEPRISEAV